MGRTTLLKAAVAATAWAAMAAPAQAAIVGSTPSPSWQTNGRVTTITVSGTTAYIGGKFTSLRPSGAPAGTGEVTRNHAAAINLTTGALLPWNPNVNGVVSAISVNGSTVYLGGGFGTVGGVTRKKAAAVDASTGALITAWRARNLNAEVRAIEVSNGRVYLGGAFTTPRSYAAAFDPAAGALDSGWAPVTDGPVDAIETTSDGSNHVVLGGAFNTLNGVSSSAIGAVDPVTGGAVDHVTSDPITWNWHGPVRFGTHPFDVVSLANFGGNMYAAGTGNGGSFMKFTPATGDLVWIEGVTGNVENVVVIDGIAYAGGHFEAYCGAIPGNNFCTRVALRNHLIAVDDTTGVLQSWHSAANSNLGVFAIAAGPQTLVVGGDFTRLGGVAQQMFGMFKE
ncbi:MAG TPA: hypothetical protein VLB81_11475 [Gaiellales bacterium]|nr:hypothetical protein [Gaiellales bacterium]